MAKTKSEKAYQHFEDFMRRLLAVPKSELKQMEKRYKTERLKTKKKR